jgi:CheY-like chemotaxis protein
VAGKAVLLVQESRASIALMASALGKMEMPELRVLSATTAHQAVEVAGSCAPDLIVLDLHLPAPGALEVVRQVKLQYATPVQFGFTFLPGESVSELLLQAHESGAAFLLAQPHEPADLQSKVQLLLGLPAQFGQPHAQAGQPGRTPAAASALQGKGRSGEGLGQPPSGVAAREPQGAQPVMPQPSQWRDSIEYQLRQALGSAPFRLVVQTEEATEIPDALLVTLLSASPEQPPWGVTVMDIPAACMVGGGALKLMPEKVRPAIADGKPTTQMVNAVAKFWRDCVSSEHSSWCTQSTSTRTALVEKSSALFRVLYPQATPDSKVYAMLQGEATQIACQLHMPGYGQGRVMIQFFK